MKVSATPMPVARANSRSAGRGADRARRRCRPARSGARRPRMISAAAISSRPLGSGAADAARTGSGSASTVAAMTSSGSSMCVGPGFCACATLNALRTTSGICGPSSGARSTSSPGGSIETTSMYWCDSLCIRSRSAWPVSATSGERSSNASATPVTRFVAPGPSVPRQTPARCVQAAVHVGHVGPALLVANRDEGDRRVVERLVEIERLLARDPEDVLDALGLQALDEQVRRLALRHDSLSSQLPCALPCPATLGNGCRQTVTFPARHDPEPPRHHADRRRCCSWRRTATAQAASASRSAGPASGTASA